MEENSYQPPGVSPGHADFVPAELVEEQAEKKPAYWGFWATIGFSLLVAVVYVAVNIVVVIGFMVASDILDPGFDPTSSTGLSKHNGLLLSIGSMVSTPVVVGLVLLFIRFRRGTTLRQYLALDGVAYRTVAFWLAATALFIVCTDGLSHATGHDVVPPFMMDAWQTAGWLPLLWLALIVLAPLSEETFFRGFLFVGLQHSPIGNAGAILVTSFTWAAVHLQYNFFHMSIIFAIGILLGIARIRSQSLYVPLAMHGLMNLVATIEAAWVMR